MTANPLRVLFIVALSVFLLNIPFGFWRAGTRKFSAPWFAAIHLPIPLVAGVRVCAGLGWHARLFPFLCGAYFLGQYVGGLLRRQTRPGD